MTFSIERYEAGSMSYLQKKGDWFAGQYGPFCSKRCKLVDLGKWLNEEHKVSEPLRPDHFQEFEKLRSDERLDDPQTDSRG